MSYTVFGGLQLLALARYGGEVAWNSPASWLYVAFLISVLGLGVYGWQQSRQLVDVSGTPAAPARI